MFLKNTFVLFIIAFISLACSSSYDELSKNSFSKPSNFSEHLSKEYHLKADFEAKEMHDWNSAKLYSEKSLKALKGIKVKPQEISYWKISDKYLSDLKRAYQNVITVYPTAIDSSPYELAIAISSLDCWSEQQEENWQFWDIEECKNNYLNAMHNIYKNLSHNDDVIITSKSNLNNNYNNSLNEVKNIQKDKNKITKQIIYFDFDKSSLNKISLSEIEIFLSNYRNEINEYLIEGHTDTKGTKNYNLNLSLNRALVIKDFLIKNGVDNLKIKLSAKGEDDLAIKTRDEIAHPANRRAEIYKLN